MADSVPLRASKCPPSLRNPVRHGPVRAARSGAGGGNTSRSSLVRLSSRSRYAGRHRASVQSAGVEQRLTEPAVRPRLTDFRRADVLHHCLYQFQVATRHTSLLLGASVYASDRRPTAWLYCCELPSSTGGTTRTDIDRCYVATRSFSRCLSVPAGRFSPIRVLLRLHGYCLTTAGT